MANIECQEVKSSSISFFLNVFWFHVSHIHKWLCYNLDSVVYYVNKL